MSVTITEILGTDSISGSRLTINSNFLLLENAYNDLENTFNMLDCMHNLKKSYKKLPGSRRNKGI